MKCDLEEQASVVHRFEGSRAERVPWLERIDFSSRLTRLKNDEIESSYILPLKKELNIKAQNTKNPNLVHILVVVEAVLRNAYQLCTTPHQTGK